jgi:hypothetical protein
MERVRDFIRAEFSDNVQVLDELLGAFHRDDVIDAPSQALGLIVDVLSAPVLANPRVIKRSLNRLVLLLGDKTRWERVRSTDRPQVLRRLVLWMAGAERFRSFRQFFREAAITEYLGAIYTLLDSREHVLSEAVSDMTRMSGLREYMNLYNLKSSEWLEERNASTSSKLVTLRDIDDFLSAAGL